MVGEFAQGAEPDSPRGGGFTPSPAPLIAPLRHFYAKKTGITAGLFPFNFSENQ
jgi:hypothetical protein